MGPAKGIAAHAARMAGFAPNSRNGAAVRGRKLLALDKVKAAIKERVEDDPKVTTRQELQEFWTRGMRGEENEFKAPDRIKCSELAAKVQGLFLERIEINDTTPGPDMLDLSLLTPDELVEFERLTLKATPSA